MNNRQLLVCTALIAFVVTGCGGGGGKHDAGGTTTNPGPTNTPPTSFAVGGTVSGLPAGSSVVLQNNGGGDQTVAGSANFSFGNFQNGTAYAITVKTHPSFPAYDCTLTDGSGAVNNADVRVAVTCQRLPQTQLSATPNAHRVELAWTTDTAVATYKVLFATAPGCDPQAQNSCTVANTSDANTVFFNLTGLTNQTTYYIKIQTIYPHGQMDISDERSATPDVWQFSGPVQAIAIDSAGTQYVGGSFGELQLGNQAVTRTRKRLAAFDATGALLAWNPSADGGVVSALKLSNNVLYVGGSFTSLGGDIRYRNIVALDVVSGTPLPAFTPPTLANPSQVSISALEISGNQLFVGGDFHSNSGNFILDLDHASGQPVAGFTPNINGPVNTIVAPPDSLYFPGNFLIYVGGSFTSAGGQPRQNLALLFKNNGEAATDFQPNPDGPVDALGYRASGDANVKSTLYVGGSFRHIRGPNDGPGAATAQVSNLAAVVIDTGVALQLPNSALLFGPLLNSTVQTMTVDSGQIYVGGLFTTIGNSTPAVRAVTFATDTLGRPTTLLPGPWRPEPDSGVSCIANFGDNSYVGGSFTSAGAAARNGFAAVRRLDGVAIP